ncbi:pre-mRNA-splicing factor ISY1 [Colletotrichum scovillei]|uniref:pre-mRNA-splicing factor ISY1 n=1 Tax=Colletotrichum scovillei TaxID=1209932 RepID=UPI0015C3E45F|nr:pre-mRNA-splicing factor ISY1 [Colletotrichum scovillei]KAF4778995.1 pre-mRNA-splicing factor ISY1 [Colletotrichum scovillei]
MLIGAGAKLGKGAVHAVSLSRSASSGPGHYRHRPDKTTESDHRSRFDTVMRVLKEISRKVSKIQDTALSDYQIRDLNDEINKLMREKYMWEVQIRNLGGPNYMRGGGKIYEEGREIPGGGKGYRYFGRARDLPGVKELFDAAKAKATNEKPLETRDDLRKQVDAAYYGYAPDEEDPELLAYELAKEEEALAHMAKTGKQQLPPDWEALRVTQATEKSCRHWRRCKKS